MFGSHVRMVQCFCFLTGQCQDLFYPRRVRNIANHLRLGMRTHMLFDFHSHCIEIEPHFLEDIDCNTLSKFDQTQQKMLCPDVIMIESVGLLARPRASVTRKRASE